MVACGFMVGGLLCVCKPVEEGIIRGVGAWGVDGKMLLWSERSRDFQSVDFLLRRRLRALDEDEGRWSLEKSQSGAN